jgi:hypothetical protein
VMNGQAIGRRLSLAVASCAAPMEFILADENERKMRSAFEARSER